MEEEEEVDEEEAAQYLNSPEFLHVSVCLFLFCCWRPKPQASDNPDTKHLLPGCGLVLAKVRVRWYLNLCS